MNKLIAALIVVIPLLLDVLLKYKRERAAGGDKSQSGG